MKEQSYEIESISLFVRETPPPRMTFALGRQLESGPPPAPSPHPLAYVRLILREEGGGRNFGCSGDGLSVRWLDKRPGRSDGRKIRDLVDLIYYAREVYLEGGPFQSPFEHWWACHSRILEEGRRRDQEDLTSSFASALMERALLDAFCRLAGQPVFQMVRESRLGIRAERVHPELQDFPWRERLPRRPLTRFYIRHTVGLTDPLKEADLSPQQRVNDGEPETLEEYIRRDGLRYFKVKISGEPEWDLQRLEALWEVLPKEPDTAVTLDANEAYRDLEAFNDFVQHLRSRLLGLFQHILYIEQPLSRELTHDPRAEPWIRRIGRDKPVIIDESDGTLEAFKRAFSLGYQGTSHKNCKGFFKSLLNFALISLYQSEGKEAFLSGEDLSLLPLVPLQQDFAALGVLGLTHCERNGHHYHYGLAMLSETEKASAARHHRDLYIRRGNEWFLNIQDGRVECASLQCPGFGVREEPDWSSMRELRSWLEERHPA